MKKLLFAFCGVVAISMLLSSCSDDSNGPSTKGDMLPLTNGTYWLYDNYEIDSNGVAYKIDGYDSVVVAGTSTIMEKTASIVKTISINPDGTADTPTDNYYYLENSNALYMHSKAFTDALSSSLFPIQLTEKWMKIADEDDEDWKVYEENIDAIQGPFGTVITGKVIITGERGGTKNFTVKNKSISTNEYKMNINFTGSATLNNIPIGLNFDRVMLLYFADGIGLVSQKMSAFKLPIVNLPLPGSETILTNYSIK